MKSVFVLALLLVSGVVLFRPFVLHVVTLASLHSKLRRKKKDASNSFWEYYVYTVLFCRAYRDSCYSLLPPQESPRKVIPPTQILPTCDKEKVLLIVSWNIMSLLSSFAFA